jgi:hypothetical protein
MDYLSIKSVTILEPQAPDELFREETQAMMAAAGHNVHLIMINCFAT